MTDNAQAWTVYNSLMVDPLTHTVYSAGEEVHLPEMEYQLLYYFLQHPGQTLSRKTLMLAVWGAPPGLKTRTLDIHICQLRKKLKLGSSLQTVFKVGYTTKNHNHTPFACHCDKVGGPLFFCFIHIILSVVHRAWWSSGGRAAYSWGSCW